MGGRMIVGEVEASGGFCDVFIASKTGGTACRR